MGCAPSPTTPYAQALLRGWRPHFAVVYRGRVMGQALRASRTARRIAVADQSELALPRSAERPIEVRAGWTLPLTEQTPGRCRSAAGLRLASWSLSDDECVER